jgi:hypothetical protein
MNTRKQFEWQFQVVGLRLSRVKHACVPNADHWYDNDRKVRILFSERDIKGVFSSCNVFVQIILFWFHFYIFKTVENLFSQKVFF